MKDTAGQEKFSALAPIYYRDAEGKLLLYFVHMISILNGLGAVLVYDITYKESFAKVWNSIRLKNWLKFIGCKMAKWAKRSQWRWYCISYSW